MLTDCSKSTDPPVPERSGTRDTRDVPRAPNIPPSQGGRLARALRITPHQALVREMVLQLKKGFLNADYFQDKFGVNIIDHWRNEWDKLVADELAHVSDARVELTRAGLLQVDGLLPAFFEPEHRGVRYT